MTEVTNRALYIDCVPEKSENIVTVESANDARGVIERFSELLVPPALVLDCRTLPRRSFNVLLKFIEEYESPITLIARDPVPGTILSRFTEIKKSFDVEAYQFRSVVELHLKFVRGKMKDRLNSLFGIREAESEDFVEQ